MKTCPICNKQTISKADDIINDIEGYHFVVKAGYSTGVSPVVCKEFRNHWNIQRKLEDRPERSEHTIRSLTGGGRSSVDGKRCTSCGEEFLDEEEGERMIHIAKKLGIWGEPLRLHRKLSKSARGTVLRIPTDIEKNLHLKGDENVLISKVRPNKILVEVEID
ncbi:MAG: hypothetical protein AABX82_03140 [Nanoarchaeota archaeon]